MSEWLPYLAAAEASPSSNPLMATEVIVAIVAGLSAVMVALVGKLSFDMIKVKRSSAAAHHFAQKTESSINHRDTPMSDRIDAVMTAVKGVAATQATQGTTLKQVQETQVEQGRDIRGLRKDDGLMRGEVREVRKDLSEHLIQAEESMAVVRRMAPIVNRLNPDK